MGYDLNLALPIYSLVILSIALPCQTRGGISVDAPQLVNPSDRKNSEKEEIQSKKSPILFDRWWRGALKRGCEKLFINFLT